MRKIATSFILMAAMAFAGDAQAFSVTTSTDGNALASTIFFGSGIAIVPGSVSYIGGATSSGSFSGGLPTGIGINSGLIMTSGNANFAAGPNTSDSAGQGNGMGGDADLNALIPQNTYDAAVLEFDFTTTGGDLFFNYVFASEEYNEYVNSSYNDVFGFFLDGVNIALIPSTSTPVSINNVNLGAHSAYYNNNDPSDGLPTPYWIQYDGFTDVFTATATGLGAGQHHIKLAIADAGDHVLDSAVFIQGGTFSDQPTPTPEPSTLLLLGSGLVGLAAMRRRAS